MKVNKGDRTILAILAILLIGYVAYATLRRPSAVADATPPPVPFSTYTPTPDSLGSEERGTDTPTVTPPHTDTLPLRTERYPGPPPESRWTGIEKLPVGATIDLNGADTILLQRVPGIGPSFARRIVKYRDLLGGYYVVEQLQEVYGMERERYDKIAPYFVIRTQVKPLEVTQDSIPYHPYLQWRHRRVLKELLRKGAPITWTELMQSPAFSRDDSLRLAPYLLLSSDRLADIKPTP